MKSKEEKMVFEEILRDRLQEFANHLKKAASLKNVDIDTIFDFIVDTNKMKYYSDIDDMSSTFDSLNLRFESVITRALETKDDYEKNQENMRLGEAYEYFSDVLKNSELWYKTPKAWEYERFISDLYKRNKIRYSEFFEFNVRIVRCIDFENKKVNDEELQKLIDELKEKYGEDKTENKK